MLNFEPIFGPSTGFEGHSLNNLESSQNIQAFVK